MPIHNIPRVDGVATVGFEYGTMDRNSPAWSPITGKAYKAYKPRIESGIIPVFKPKPKVYYNFSEPTLFMGYNSTMPLDPAPTGKYLVGAGGRMEEFEAAYPEFDKILLGQSSGTVTGAKNVYGYRLIQTGAVDPLNTKHCVITHGVHGNEMGGLDGAFKAMEVIARNPDFANFRAEYTLLFIPVLNPDGYHNYLRNLEAVGPNGHTVNLNRNFDWFWAEYVESGAESKGAAPGDSQEAQNILTYYASVVAAGGRFGALFDFHSTSSGVGARYQSRDRIWRDILYGPGEGGEVPDNYLTYYLDAFIWRIHRAVATKRFLEYGGPDRFVRYQRSRFYPHMHSYFSSLGAFSMIAEEVKYPNSKNDVETIAAACNYRLDYIISFCKAVTLDNWEFKDGVLVEKETENILVNAEWSDWSVEEDGTQRPAYTGIARCVTDRITSTAGEKFFEDNGEAVQVNSDIDVVLGDDSEYCAISYAPNTRDPTEGGAAAILYPGSGVASGVLYYPYNSPSSYIASPLATHTSLFSAAIAGTHYSNYSVTPQIVNRFIALGGGTAALANATADVTQLDFYSDGTVGETALLGHGYTARMAAGYCTDNPSFPAVCYAIGGQDNIGVFLDTMGTYDWFSNTWTLSTQVLTAPTRGCFCAYRDGYAYIFGGETAGGFATTIYEWNIGTDTITDLTGTVALPKALAFAGAAYDDYNDVIYIYGGEENTGDMSSTFYVFDPDAYTIQEIIIYQNLSDDEDVQEEAEGFVPWSTLQGRWPAVYNPIDQVVTLAGGRTVDGAGTVVDGVYAHDPGDSTMNIVRSSGWDYGYIRYGLAIQSGTQETGYLPGDDFTGHLTEYEDPNNSWSIAGADLSCTTGGALYHDFDSVDRSSERTDADQMQEAAVRLSGAGTIATFSLVVRGDFNNVALDQPTTVTGVTIYEVSSNNYASGGGDARLRYDFATQSLYYRQPGSLTEGAAVAVGAGGYFTLYAYSTSVYIRVFVVVASLPVGNITENLGQVSDGSLEDGYRLYYHHGTTTWYLQRVCTGSVWNLDSYVGSALNAVARRVKLMATGTDPVTIRAWIDGTERLTATDSTEIKVTSDDGETGIEACAGSVGILVSEFRVAQMPEKTIAVEEFGDSTFDSFDDVNSAWAVSSTGGYGYPTGAGGPLLCTETFPYYQHRIDCIYKKSGAGNIDHFSLAARATYVGDVIRSGYIATLDVTGATFTVYRVVGGIQTSIGTWGHAFGTTEHKIGMRVTGQCPVRIYMYYSGATAYADQVGFDYYDFHANQVVDLTGTCAMSAAGDVANVYIRQLIVQSGAELIDRFAHSMSVKSHATNVSGYTRININPKDDTDIMDSITRYNRDYYTLPPKIAYWWYHIRTDLADGVGERYYEDGLRVYQRVYKHNQKFLMDGMHLQQGSLIPSSWQHPEVPRLAETFTFSDVVNANSFRVSFYWLPTCSFLDIRENDLEIFRVSVDVNNYVRLYAKGYSGARLLERNYYTSGYMSGPHDPELILEKVRGGLSVAEVSVINYWNHSLRTGGGEREDYTIKFVISHFAGVSNNGGALELSVETYGSAGTERSFDDLTAFSGYVGSMRYTGVGFFSVPQIEDTAQVTTGRVVSTQRRGLIERARGDDRPSLQVGDRDVTGGELVYQPYNVLAGATFGEGDTFTRANASHLGSYWETHYPYFDSRTDRTTGSGFDILNNRAIGYAAAVAVWKYRIGHTDIAVVATGSLSVNTAVIGVLARYDRSLWSSDYVAWRGLTCYALHLQQNNATQAVVSINRWHLGVATVLATKTFDWYATGQDHTLIFDLSESTLTGYVSRGANSEIIVATDINYRKAGQVGILSIGTNSFGSFTVVPNFESEIE